MTGVDLRKLTNDQLLQYLANCQRALQDRRRRERAKLLIPALKAEISRRGINAAKEIFSPLLEQLGYNVRRHGPSQATRQAIIDKILDSDLPFVVSEAYMRTWGEPKSRQRYVTLYRTIQLYLRNYGGSSLNEMAAERWTVDLGYIERRAKRTLSPVASE